MKARSLFLAAALATLSCTALAQTGAPEQGPGFDNPGVETPYSQSRAQFLQRLDNRLAILQGTRQCIAASQDMMAAKACFDQEHTATAQLMGIQRHPSRRERRAKTPVQQAQ